MDIFDRRPGLQWFPTIGGGEPRCANWSGPKALMLAILEDAIRAYHGPSGCQRDEVALWMAERRRHWVFSFATICETLNLEPTAVHAAVVRMRSDHGIVQRSIRSRPYSRRDRRQTLVSES
jgi:hypothetical protein